MSVLYGVVAAILIGFSDTFGSQSSRRSSALQAVTAAFWAAAIGALLIAPVTGEPRGEDLLLGAISGLAAAAALTTLWRAYTISAVGVGAPVAAVVGGVLPVVVDAARGDSIGAWGVVGIVVGLGSLVLTTWSTDGRPIVAGAALGALAGVFFGVMFVLGAETSVDSGVWPVAAQRVIAGTVATSIALGRGLPVVASWPATRLGIAAGVAGGGGVAATILGGQRHEIGPIAVAASLYPAVVIALHWLLWRERLRWWQTVGLVGTLLGVALLAAD